MGTDPIVLQVFHLESIVEWQLEALQKHRIEVVCTDCCLTMLEKKNSPLEQYFPLQRYKQLRSTHNFEFNK
jgi:hypothetical protein